MLLCCRHCTNSTVGLEQRVKRFPLQKFVSKQDNRRCHSPFGEQWLDKQSLHTNSPQPLPDALGRELSRESLRIFSGTPLQMNRSLETIFACELLGDIDREAPPSELVHDRQPSASGSAGPRKYGRPRGKNSIRGYDDSNVAERTSSLEPESLSFRLLFRHF